MSVTCPRCSKTFRFGFGSHVWKCDVTQGEMFWARVDKNGPNGCWIWKGATKRGGYGLVGRHGRGKKVVAAHRYAWELTHGPFPEGSNPREYSVCHHCDNPICVRPDHLFVGTYQDNADDKVAKGRQLRGSMNPKAKLDEEKVAIIRREYRYENRRSNSAELAARFGCSIPMIQAVVARRNWKHVA